MRRTYAVCRWAAQMLFIFLFRGRIFGTHRVPRHGGVLLVSNHQSFLDPPLVTLALPRECNYMARDSLFRNPILRRVIESLNAFPVKRGTADMGAIRETFRRLKSGKIVLAFPEGTRTVDGNIGTMRPGVILLARKARVPIVPAVILGAFESWPRSARFPRPRPIVIAYAEPFSPHEHPDLTDDECIEHVRTRMLAMKSQYETHPILQRVDTPRTRLSDAV